MMMATGRWIAPVLFSLAVGAATPAAAQSFGCAGTLQPDEKAVCDNGTLSALDDEMSALYTDIEHHALMGTSGETRDDQRQFLADRAACGANDSCIEQLYKHRIAVLKRTKEDVGQGAAQ